MSAEMKFVREDWMLFRNIDTLCQKAGVSRENMPRLVVKELVDNALDVSNDVSVHALTSSQIVIADDGIGFSPEEIGVYFSINRPLVSTKLLRLPQRGALGNGLRVVTGAVTAYGGKLFVVSRGNMYAVVPQSNGTSKVEHLNEVDVQGTRVIVDFDFDVSADVLKWGENAIRLSQGKFYKGKSSPFWYTSESFYDLVNATQGELKTLLGFFSGLTKPVIKNICEYFGKPKTHDMTFAHTDELLGMLRQYCSPVDKKQLGSVGELEFTKESDYKKVYNEFTLETARGNYDAIIPYCAEVWAQVSDNNSSSFDISVNRTPITGKVIVNYYNSNEMGITGCGFNAYLKGKPAHLMVNVITPYMPITSDGKEPNFYPMRTVITKLAQKVMKRAKRTAQIKKAGSSETKDLIFRYIPGAANEAGDNGRLPFSQRQLYYVIRPTYISIMDKELEYNYFCRLISEYESKYGEIKGLYRSARGMLYHPHMGKEIKLGTHEVDAYERPKWTFNKVLYIEKDAGYFPMLQAAQFPERYDCALVTSQGHASRAVKDLFDLLGDTNEEIQFFVIHDADAAGTMIYQTLQYETIARPGRRVKIINLGLDPWEAVDMGLQVETIKRKNNSQSRLPVARYVDSRNDGWEWKQWMQSKRIELNAMPPSVFVNWLEEKMNEYGVGKVIPPSQVLETQLISEVESLARSVVRERLLREAGYDQLVQAAIAELTPAVQLKVVQLTDIVKEQLTERTEYHWTKPINGVAMEVIKSIK